MNFRGGITSTKMQTMATPSTEWHVYIIHSETLDRTYVGITTDPQRRLRQHNGELRGGAKSTRTCNDWKIHRLLGPCTTRSQALQLEHKVKSLSKEERLKYEKEAE